MGNNLALNWVCTGAGHHLSKTPHLRAYIVLEEGALVPKIICMTSTGSPEYISWSTSGAKRDGSKAQAENEILSHVPETEDASCSESPRASHWGVILSPRANFWSANKVPPKRDKTLVDRPCPGLLGAEQSVDMHKDAVLSMCGPCHPDPGRLGDLERSRGDSCSWEAKRSTSASKSLSNLLPHSNAQGYKSPWGTRTQGKQNLLD